MLVIREVNRESESKRRSERPPVHRVWENLRAQFFGACQYGDRFICPFGADEKWIVRGKSAAAVDTCQSFR